MMQLKDMKFSKYRKKLFILTGILFCLNVFGQQDPLYTQYLNNLVSVNPAYAGSSENLSIICLNRQQWVGLEGAPKTASLSMNTPLKFVNVGLGLSLIYDELGPFKQTGIYVDYSYHVNVTHSMKLSMGVKGGFNNYNMNLKELISHSLDDHIAGFGERKLFLPNFGVGLYLHSKNFYLGLSSPKLLENSLVDNESTLEIVDREERHYFLMGASLITMTDFLKMKPSFMTRVVFGAPLSVELTNSFIINDRLWLGAMYRFGDSVGGLVQFQISPQLRVGYAYDMTQSKLRNESSGTHEIMLSWDFLLSNQRILSPRFF